jgi:hypothetical protein
MNVLPFDRQVEVISALVEGCSIRAVERLTGIHRDTIMRLGARVDHGCGQVHDALMRDLQVPRIEFDKAWSFIGKKQKKAREEENDEIGDQYVFLALAGSAKAIISYRVGKRTAETTRRFVADVRERVLGAPEISSDAFQKHLPAIEAAFGIDCDYGADREAVRR